MYGLLLVGRRELMAAFVVRMAGEDSCLKAWPL